MSSSSLRVRTISSPRVIEGEPMIFDVALTGPANNGSSLTFNLGGSGTAGLDYRSRPEVSFDGGRTFTVLTSSTINLPKNTCDFKLRVNTFNDRLIEATDSIVLETRMNGKTESATGSLLDDDKGLRVVSVVGQDVVEGNSLVYKVNLAGGPTQPCTTPGANCPPEKWTCTTSNGKGSIDLGDYKIELQENNSVWVLTNKTTGACTRIWGDPHVDVKNDGINDFDFKKDMTFQLADGTKITVETVAWGNSGMTLSSRLIITDWCNQNAMVVSGLGWDSDGANNLKVQKLDGEGRSLDLKTPDGAFTLYENSEGGWHIFDGRVPNQNLINQLEAGTLRDTSADVTLNLVAGSATLNNDYRGQVEVSLDDGRTWTRIDANKLTVPTKLDHFLVRIPTLDDTQVENRETVSLKAEAVCGTATGEGGILDNDVPPPPPVAVTSVSAAVANEGDALCFNVSLNRTSTTATPVTLALSNGTAMSGVDFATTGLQVSFDGGRTFSALTGSTVNVPANASSFQVKVASIEDTVFEGNETFTLRASTGTSSASGIGTICEDDSAPKVTTVSPAQANEGDALCFNVGLSNASTTPTTVTLALASGSATAGTDFATTGLQVSFDGGRTFSAITGTSVNVPANTTSFQVKVASIEDSAVEPNETFTLQATSNGGSATGTGTILNDDVAPPPPPPPPPLDPSSFMIVGAAKLLEGGPRSDFTIRLAKPVDYDVTVTLKVSDITANRASSEAAGQTYVKDQGTYNDWRSVLPDATVGKGSLTKDFTVYDSAGQVVAGDTLTVTIRAGQLVSSPFGVQAWQEVQRVSQRGAEIEGDETFRLQITSLNGQTPTTAIGTDVTVCDNHVGRISPIIIDMDGDGVQTTSIETSTASFDMDLDGVKDKTGWISKTDAFLAHDANTDGQINDRSELFGGQIGEGFAKLDSFDSNRDGMVDRNDERFAELKVWQDKDSDGSTDAGELISLDAAGIASLRTSYNMDPELQNGNMLIERSSVTFSDGREAAVADAYFQVESSAEKLAMPKLADLIIDDAHDAIPLGKLGDSGGRSAVTSKDSTGPMPLESGTDLDNLLHKPVNHQD